LRIPRFTGTIRNLNYAVWGRVKRSHTASLIEALKLQYPELAEVLSAYNEAKQRYVTASEKM
jgi:hypothetical protein